jgi:hypothetical protein
MIQQIVQWNHLANIRFNDNAFEQCHVHTSIEQDTPREGGGNSAGNDANVEALDAQDAIQLKTDELWNSWKMPWWWFVEILPTFM